MLGVRFAWVAALSFLVAGCVGAFSEHVKVDPASVDALRLQIPVYTETDLRGRDYSVLEPLRATSCMNKVMDPSPTTEDATDQLRVKAARLGGNGLFRVTCEAPSSAGFITTCWSSLTCHGAAVKVTR